MQQSKEIFRSRKQTKGKPKRKEHDLKQNKHIKNGKIKGKKRAIFDSDTSSTTKGFNQHYRQPSILVPIGNISYL